MLKNKLLEASAVACFTTQYSVNTEVWRPIFRNTCQRFTATRKGMFCEDRMWLEQSYGSSFASALTRLYVGRTKLFLRVLGRSFYYLNCWASHAWRFFNTVTVQSCSRFAPCVWRVLPHFVTSSVSFIVSPPHPVLPLIRLHFSFSGTCFLLSLPAEPVILPFDTRVNFLSHSLISSYWRIRPFQGQH
jgi:hypothetical protein